MNLENYFPTGIVVGDAFCNREREREFLAKRFQQNAHVVLMSPRRYGKSSLLSQFTFEQEAPFTNIDLLPAISPKYVKNAIVDAVTQLLDAVMPQLKKSKQKLMHHFALMNPVIELSALGQRIKLQPDEKTPEETIMKLLLSLDKAAIELKQRFIFIMDEFQQIANLENSHALEASIRHAVERSKHVFYVFSGSNRTLLKKMFSDKDRPLYHLCDEMKLDRIGKEHYIPFIKKASKKAWRKLLSEDSLDKILELSACHPYYVNRLCRLLWDAKTPPDVKTVEKTWQAYIKEQRMDWIAELIGGLTVNQRIVLAALARAPEREVMGKEFMAQLELSLSSIRRSITTLRSNDLIYQNEEGYYHVLNPAVESILAADKYFN